MKRLVVCCDGTWNQLSGYPTNVVKLSELVQPVGADGVTQVVYYQAGLGTQWYDRIPGGAFGWGIDYNIKTAYEFLCLNYQPGDEIYLFGFSRGAYTVRSLAGLIYCSGLLQRQHIRRIEEAYSLYRDRQIKPRHAQAQNFRSQYGVTVKGDTQIPITLLGCWDTVGSLGIPNILPLLPFNDLINRRYRFHDHQLNRKIGVALHAVAIDEHRKAFDVTRMFKSPKNPDQIVRQMWFPGVHGCVGGGTEIYQGLSDQALQWMIDSIAEVGLGLTFDVPPELLQLNPLTPFDANPGIYALAGVHDRAIPPTVKVLHNSTIQRWHQDQQYRPRSLKRLTAQLKALSLSARVATAGKRAA